mmetsp:Transcript_6892/g.8936  ORF Transcript_6892/g.8936 Transcript_6892/m.8936 type:complete len:271 (-) Transcript_6892:85-897(-)
MPRFLVLVLLVLTVCDQGFSFELPKLPSLSFGGKLPAIIDPTAREVREKKNQLLEAISYTSNGKAATPEQLIKVAGLVRTLENLAPAPVDILTSDAQTQLIDGVWYLQWTSPSDVGGGEESPDAWKPQNAQEGDSRINTRRFAAKGNVEAAGITVDTSNRMVQQIFNVKESTVVNKVDLGWGQVQAGGAFRASSTVPYRAIVSFNQADITLENGFLIQLGWWFNVLPVFKKGSRDNGWLETTYIDKEIRIGRGNLGTLFVLTRDPDLVPP